MKYYSSFKNHKEEEFTISSMEDYIQNPTDIESFSKVLSDEPVRKYITNDAMKRWNHPTVESLAKEILSTSGLRWREGKELRFLVRDSSGSAIGMIGVTLKNLTSGELWYYKTSQAPPYMYKALALALDFLKQEGATNLFATFEQSNIRSIQILTNLGFKDSKPGEMVIAL